MSFFQAIPLLIEIFNVVEKEDELKDFKPKLIKLAFIIHTLIYMWPQKSPDFYDNILKTLKVSILLRSVTK